MKDVNALLILTRESKDLFEGGTDIAPKKSAAISYGEGFNVEDIRLHGREGIGEEEEDVSERDWGASLDVYYGSNHL
ncbi:hypothetical protein L2E82_32768 [Cichorium intybus]|uniref:Uncharacterized protein n=1 Tax=Cichorium intybus TaxID=13427 RepID=A0ACB9BJ39_CICIN|nr:hypothetical protein L2E82_32768 [Cichorium intybus]